MFLPFTPKGKETEKTAVEVKRKLGLGPYDAVDPFEVLPSVPARLIDAAILPLELRSTLCQHSEQAWSAIGYGRSPADGHEMILLNPEHHPHRQKASLMEELVHILLNHPKVPLLFDGDEWKRPFDASVEDEAFNVGAACLIPYRSLFNAVRYRHSTTAELADTYGVSVAYVDYRIKRAGLHRVYRKYCS